ncbi:hypothetical protein VTI28DRAFT_5122 [Corynascus sepedonium]
MSPPKHVRINEVAEIGSDSSIEEMDSTAGSYDPTSRHSQSADRLSRLVSKFEMLDATGGLQASAFVRSAPPKQDIPKSSAVEHDVRNGPTLTQMQRSVQLDTLTSKTRIGDDKVVGATSCQPGLRCGGPADQGERPKTGKTNGIPGRDARHIRHSLLEAFEDEKRPEFNQVEPKHACNSIHRYGYEHK